MGNQMLHRGIRYVHAAILVFSALIAFLFIRGLDESTPLGNAALVDVFDSDESVSAPRVAQAVAQFATENRVTIARDMTDLRNPDGVRDLYVTPGNSESAAAAWLTEGYPSFSDEYKTHVHPFVDSAQRDPRGPYFIYGSAPDADALRVEFASLGLTASVSHPLSRTELSDQLQGDPLVRALAIIALAVLTTTGASVLLGGTGYAVLRLQGMSFTSILLRDLRQLAPFWAASVTIVTAVALSFLGFYNHFAWLGLFGAVAAGIYLLLTLVAVMTHAAVLGLTFKVKILGALKGELPSRAASIAVYVVRIPALLLALSIATSVAIAGRDVVTREESREAYLSVSEAVTIRINGGFAPHMDQVNEHVGPWLREADKLGEVIVAGRRDLQVSTPGAPLPTGEIFIVNDTYLSREKVVDPAGKRLDLRAGNLRTQKNNPVAVIIPQHLGAQSVAIKKAAADIIDPERSRHLAVEVLESRNGQDLFGYNSGSYAYHSGHSPDEDRSEVRDPVLIVVPNGSTLLSDDAYTAFATQAGVIFLDPHDALNGIEERNLQDYVNAVSPVGQKTAKDLRGAVSKLRLQVFNLVLAVLVLLVAGAGACLIYARKNAQGIFVKQISGWSYTATHRFVLAAEVAIAVIFATRVPFVAWQQHREAAHYAAAGAPAPYEPLHITALDVGIITGLVVFEFGAVLVALAFFHRRVIRTAAAAL
ncbi:hypothetical protein ABZ401_22160 [Streptomyces sp. NPDC005892]|uniref:hypothetical protein n=1 Tax=Streptomyces sp. NPDC005892 TaxID=3155593 RepID=UPI0033F15E70